MHCFPSLARAEKKLLRLAGEMARRAGGVSHPVIPQGKQKGRNGPPHGKQNGHDGRRKGNKRALWPPQGEQKGRYAPVGVRPPPPLRGSSPCEAGQFIPASFDCRHSEVCKSRNSVSLNSPNSFFQMVLNPQECGMFLNICNKYRLPLQKARNLAGKLSFPAQILCSPVSFIFQKAQAILFSRTKTILFLAWGISHRLNRKSGGRPIRILPAVLAF